MAAVAPRHGTDPAVGGRAYADTGRRGRPSESTRPWLAELVGRRRFTAPGAGGGAATDGGGADESPTRFERPALATENKSTGYKHFWRDFQG